MEISISFLDICYLHCFFLTCTSIYKFFSFLEFFFLFCVFMFIILMLSFMFLLSSINFLVPSYFTFFLVVLGLLYLFSIYFYSSYSVMKISYQMFCPKL